MQQALEEARETGGTLGVAVIGSLLSVTSSAEGRADTTLRGRTISVTHSSGTILPPKTAIHNRRTSATVV